MKLWVWLSGASGTEECYSCLCTKEKKKTKNKGEYVRCRSLIVFGGCGFADRNCFAKKKLWWAGERAGQRPVLLLERVGERIGVPFGVGSQVSASYKFFYKKNPKSKTD